MKKTILIVLAVIALLYFDGKRTQAIEKNAYMQGWDAGYEMGQDSGYEDGLREGQGQGLQMAGEYLHFNFPFLSTEEAIYYVSRNLDVGDVSAIDLYDYVVGGCLANTLSFIEETISSFENGNIPRDKKEE